MDNFSVLRDQVFIDSLLANKINKVPLDTLIIRLDYLVQKFGIPFLEFKTYREYSKRFEYKIREIDSPLRKPKKYSGWVKNSSSVGSKRFGPRREPIPSFNVKEIVHDLSFLEFLTVGELMGRSVSLKHPEDEPKKVRNG
jgi:hypothetical protein